MSEDLESLGERIEAVLHPEEAARVWAALDHCAQQQCRESQRVSAETPSAALSAAPTAARARPPAHAMGVGWEDRDLLPADARRKALLYTAPRSPTRPRPTRVK